MGGFGPKNPNPTITEKYKISPISDHFIDRFSRLAVGSGGGLIGQFYRGKKQTEVSNDLYKLDMDLVTGSSCFISSHNFEEEERICL